MRRFQLCSLLLLLLLVLGSTDAAFGQVTYNYTGAPYTTAAPPYDTTMSVTGSFQLAAPLAPNQPLQIISGSVVSLSFSDGVHTYNEATIVAFAVGTDAAGNIDNWSIALSQPVPVVVNDPASFLFSDPASDTARSGTCSTVSAQMQCQFLANVNEGLSSTPGSWEPTVVDAAEIPTLSEWSLILLALLLGAVAVSRLRQPRMA